jgi:ATP-dependent protease HslVU (ClpYQ) peptidase subunit
VALHTVVCVRYNGRVASLRDGQVTLGTTVMSRGREDPPPEGATSSPGSPLFRRRLRPLSRFEMKLEEHRGNLSARLPRHDWRTDKTRQLEALLIVADKTTSLLTPAPGT